MFTQVTASAFLGSTYSMLITCRLLEGVWQSLSRKSWVQQWERELLLPCGTDPLETGPCPFPTFHSNSKWKAFLWGS